MCSSKVTFSYVKGTARIGAFPHTMCGIYFSITRKYVTGPSNDITRLLKQRGPDSIRLIQRDVFYSSSSPQHPSRRLSACLMFVATVLSLRGDAVVVQPLVDKASGSILCWNGEAWKIGEKPVIGNDAQAVFSLMLEAVHSVPEGNLSKQAAYEATSLAFKSALRSISGPFSFLFYDARFERVFYGRDVLGRRSLLITRNTGPDLTISSVCDVSAPNKWCEVEANGIYSVDLPAFLIGEFTAAHQDFSQEEPRFDVRHIPWVSFVDPSTSPDTCVSSLMMRPSLLN